VGSDVLEASRGARRPGLIDARPGRQVLTHVILASLILVSVTFHLTGIRKNLPFTHEIDEPAFVVRAVNVAASGDLNPGWFGNPGSTVIYPLAVAYHAWNVVGHGGDLVPVDDSLRAAFASDPGEFYGLGRLLAIAYAILALPVLYVLSKRVFNRRIGLMAVALSLLYLPSLSHAQTVRTDSAGTFFGLLAMWMCLRLYDAPTLRRQLLAGAAIGLAISTRYFMATLIPVLLAIDVLILWRSRDDSQRNELAVLTQAVVGGLAVAVAFAATTPYFFLDFSTAWDSVQNEARATHLGADGLSTRGNFVWYLFSAIPGALTWPQAAVATGGAVLVIWRHRPKELLLAFPLISNGHKHVFASLAEVAHSDPTLHGNPRGLCS